MYSLRGTIRLQLLFEAALDSRYSVSISIRDAQSSAQDRAWIRAQYSEYLDDLTRLSMNTGLFPVVDEYAERDTDLMARWFADDSSHPLVILKSDKPVGFALISRPPRNQRERIDFRMAEFFVTLKSRRLGVGREAAQLIFSRFAGTWEVCEFQYNKPAVAFWRSTVGEFTHGRFRESISQGEVRQVFKSAGGPSKRT